MSEERQDVEQIAKHQEIMDILIAAGYFRARIKGLSPFDKIIGGMIYCIEALDEGVDVDLLFYDSFTIGQKISLTEKIVAVLPRVECPYTIEPHQIQGLDYIRIFPVVQWLVKRSVENRAEKSERLFNFAINEFHNDFQLESASEISARCEAMLDNVDAVQRRYGPKRKFKRKDVAADEQLRVKVTLMEYASATKTTKEGVDVAELLTDLTLKGEETEFDAETREAVFDEYSNLATEFAKDDKEVEHVRQVTALKAAKVNLEKRLEVLSEENLAMIAKKQAMDEELAGVKARKVEMKNELETLREKHSNEDKEIIDKLTSLLQMTEELKANENTFKEDCKETLTKMQEQIDEYDRLAGDDADEDNRELLETEKQKLQAIRLKLAKKNRQIVVVQRQLDNVPNRGELAQYQRRFLELYNLVSAKHRETKQFYTLYNTLSDKKLYMEKEIGLLNSIYENFTATSGSVQLREQFLKQLEAIVVGVKENKVRVERRCTDEKQKKEKLNAELNCLFEQQRRYTTAIKQLKQLLHDERQE